MNFRSLKSHQWIFYDPIKITEFTLMGLFFTKCIPSSTFLWHSEFPSMNFLRSNKNQRFSMIRKRVVMNHPFQSPLKGANFFTPRCTRVVHSTRYITTTSILQWEHKKHSWGNRMDPFICIIIIEAICKDESFNIKQQR